MSEEETISSILISKMFDDYTEIPNFRAICDKCNKEFIINNQL